MGNGPQIACKATVTSFTKTILLTMGKSKRIRKKATEPTLGLMGVSMRAGGTREICTVMACIQVDERNSNTASGRMVNSSNGSTNTTLL